MPGNPRREVGVSAKSFIFPDRACPLAGTTIGQKFLPRQAGGPPTADGPAPAGQRRARSPAAYIRVLRLRAAVARLR